MSTPLTAACKARATAMRVHVPICPCADPRNIPTPRLPGPARLVISDAYRKRTFARGWLWCWYWPRPHQELHASVLTEESTILFKSPIFFVFSYFRAFVIRMRALSSARDASTQCGFAVQVHSHSAIAAAIRRGSVEKRVPTEDRGNQ
jgi:hypothetical protein